MCGPNSKKGVLGAGHVKKGGGGVTAIHTYMTYSYMRVPPPPLPPPRRYTGGVFPIQLCLNSRGGYTGPPLN